MHNTAFCRFTVDIQIVRYILTEEYRSRKRIALICSLVTDASDVQVKLCFFCVRQAHPALYDVNSVHLIQSVAGYNLRSSAVRFLYSSPFDRYSSNYCHADVCRNSIPKIYVTFLKWGSLSVRGSLLQRVMLKP